MAEVKLFTSLSPIASGETTPEEWAQEKEWELRVNGPQSK